MPSSKRRWLQFSLRTGFLLVTLLCIALSLWVAPAERQRRAVAAIEAMGGNVGYVHRQAASESFPIAFVRRWLPPVYFDEINDVDLADSQVITEVGVAEFRQALPHCGFIVRRKLVRGLLRPD